MIHRTTKQNYNISNMFEKNFAFKDT